MRLAFVLTRQPGLPSPDTLRAAHALVDSSAPTLHIDPPDEDHEGVMACHVGEHDTIHVASMPAPVPDGEADSATLYSVSSIGTDWSLPEHQAHLVVVHSTQPDRPLLESMCLFTKVVAAVAAAGDAVGVYWGEGHVTHAPEFFLELARDIEIPLMLWVGVSIATEEDDRLSVLSLGMKQLNLPDLLLTAPRNQGNEALGFFFDILLYVVRRGEPITEGETVGRNEDERLEVRYETSPVDPEQRVWRVDLPAPCAPTTLPS